MRYLTLAEALVIAETVTGIDTTVLAKAAGIELLDSALHAPQASYSGHEFYPDFVDKAAVLAYTSHGTTRCPTATNAWLGGVSPCSVP